MIGPSLATETGVVLVVEDDPVIARLERRSLERAGYDVRAVASAEEAMNVVMSGGVELIVLDQFLSGDMTGLEFHALLKEIGCFVPVIMVTGNYDEATVIEALRAGVRDFVTKSEEYLSYLPEAVERVLCQTRMERLLEESEQRYKSLFEHNPDAIFWLDLEGNFLSINAASESLIGYEAEYFIGRHFGPLIVPEDLESALEHFEMARRGEPQNYEVAISHRDGRRLDLNVTSIPIVVEGEIVGVYGIAKDITGRKALERQLEYQALHDALTRLPNRALFMNRLEHAIARADRRKGRVAVLFMDLDRFKVVNDSLTHDIGDQLLAGVAGRLRACLRSEDTAARLGGDEFAVLLEDVEEVGEATRVAERIIEALQAPFHVAGRILFVTTSIGVALDNSGETRPGDLLREADVAMYRAKTRRRSHYEVFSLEKDIHAFNRLELESDLRLAIEREEFLLHYQPVVSLETGKMIGVEALARWRHPERGLVPPLNFIPLAEETGLILPLGRWVLGEACRQAKTWQDGQSDAPPLTVSVNLSAKQLQQPGLSREVARILGTTGMDPRRLTLEITESVVMEDSETAIEAFRDLRALGVRIAIDDFGKGHSSLSSLKMLPVDVLKIDRAFVSELEKDSRDEEIMSAMIDLAHALRLTVVAEGVETAEQLDRLGILMCDLAQGFHLARPLPGEAIPDFLDSRDHPPPALQGGAGP